MIQIQKLRFKKFLGLVTIVGSLIILPQMSLADKSENAIVVGNVLQISGWFERYGNDQIVLYPVFNLPVEKMSDMADINDSEMSSSEMTNMNGMLGRGAGDKMSKNYQMTYGRFLIDKNGNLVLYPINDKSGTQKMDDTSKTMTNQKDDKP
jgi:hypothetical protein